MYHEADGTVCALVTAITVAFPTHALAVVETLVWTRLELAPFACKASVTATLMVDTVTMLRATQWTSTVTTVYSREVFEARCNTIDNFTTARYHVADFTTLANPATVACAFSGGGVAAAVVRA